MLWAAALSSAPALLTPLIHAMTSNFISCAAPCLTVGVPSVFRVPSIKLLKPASQGGHFAHILNSGFTSQ
jgi:hypothetical protein